MTTRADALTNTADGSDSIGDRKAENVAFTPGPWKVKDLSDEIGPFFIVESASFDFSVSDPRGLRVEAIIRREDAHLIASAPALYEALDRLLHETMFKDHPEASQMAIDALALAMGEKK